MARRIKDHDVKKAKKIKVKVNKILGIKGQESARGERKEFKGQAGWVG